MNRVIISLLSALLVSSLFGNTGVRDIELSASAVRKIQTWKIVQVRKMFGTDCRLFYHGTWHGWHIFSFSGGDERSFYFGKFKTQKKSVQIPDGDVVDISSRSTVSAIQGRELLGLAGDPVTAKLGPRFKVEVRAPELSHQNREEPNQPPQRNAGSRPSSGDSPASDTPSSLGPRG